MMNLITMGRRGALILATALLGAACSPASDTNESSTTQTNQALPAANIDREAAQQVSSSAGGKLGCPANGKPKRRTSVRRFSLHSPFDQPT